MTSPDHPPTKSSLSAFAALSLVAGSLLVGACDSCGGDASEHDGTGTESGPHPNASSSSDAAGSTLAPIDPWAREPLALSRICEAHRATELFSLAVSDRPGHTTALLALAYAEDVEVVLGGLAGLSRERRRTDRLDVLGVIRIVANRRPSRTERLAPESLAACVATLRELAGDTAEDAALRAVAQSALNGFVRNGVAPPSVLAPRLPASGAPSSSSAPPP